MCTGVGWVLPPAARLESPCNTASTALEVQKDVVIQETCPIRWCRPPMAQQCMGTLGGIMSLGRL